MMEKAPPTIHVHVMTAGPPTYAPVARPSKMEGMMETAVKQKAKAMRPEKPRYSSCR